jgi:hypothetical protein
MADIFKIMPNTSAANNENHIGASSAYFTKAYITELNTVTLNSTGNTSTADTIIVLNNGETGENNNDLGIAFERGSSANVAFMWDEDNARFTLVQHTIDGSSSGDLGLETRTLSTLRSIITTSSLTVEAGGSTSFPDASIAITALDIDGAGDGSISANDKFIIHDDTPGADSPKAILASALKTYISASGDALDLTNSGLAAIAELADGDRIVVSDASNAHTNYRTTFSGLKTAILTGNAATATEATNVTLSDSGNADAAWYVTLADGATGTQAIQSDTGLTFNPSTNTLTVSALTGTASLASTVTVADAGGANSDHYLAMYTSASGSLAATTDAALTYNPSTDTLTVSALTGTASLASTVTVTDSGDTNAAWYLTMVDGATGAQAVQSDTGLTFKPNTNTLTVANITGTASAATLAATATVATNVTLTATGNVDASWYVTLADGATGTQAIQSDAGLTFNPSSNILSATTFSGALSGNASTASLASTVTVTDSGNADAAWYVTLADGATGTQAVQSDTGLTFNPSTNTLTVANITGTSSLATEATNVTLSDSGNANASWYVTLADGATGTQAIQSDTGLTFNPSTNTLTVANITGTASNATLAATATVGSTVTLADAADANASHFLAFSATSTGDKALLTDSTLTFNASSNTLTTTTFSGALSGNASTATEATNVTLSASGNADASWYVTLADGATGTQAIQSDAGITYNPSSNTLTTTTFTGALSGNASSATVGTTVTVADAGDAANSAHYLAMFTSATGNLGAKTDGDLTYNPSTDTLTVSALSGTASLASTVTVTDSGNANAAWYLTMVDGATGTQAVQSDTGLTFNPNTNTLTVANITGTASLATEVTATDTGDDNVEYFVTMVDGATGSQGVQTDAGIKFNAQSNTLTVSNLTGTASLATTASVATTVTATDTGDDNVDYFVTMVDGATGAQDIQTDAGIKYNAQSNTMTVSNVTGTASLASEVTVTQNENANETVYLAFVDGVSGSQGIEADSGLSYNPSTGVLSATISGNITTATEATNVTVTANNTANETVYLTFVDGGTGGTEGIETDIGLTYNPNSGLLTTVSVAGNVAGNVTGDVTGNADTATEATNVTVSANNTANETVYLTFVDGATGTQGLETDTALSYNPSTDTLTVGTVAGSTLTSPKIVNDGYIADANGNELVQFVTTASAVNHIKVTNAATGSGAQIETVGTDTNIDLNLVAKGTGVVKVADKLHVTGQSNFDSQMTVGASGSEANLFVYGELHVDNGVAVFDTASMSLQDPLLFMAKDGAGDADIGFFGKTGTITNGNAAKDSNVACHTGLFFDSDQRNTGNGLYRLFRAPTGNVSVDNEVTVNKSQNFVNPAIEVCNIKADIETLTQAPTLDLSNRFVLVNGNYNTTLPDPSATYLGVEFVIRMISGDTPNLVPATSGTLINSSGVADDDIAFAAHGTLRAVCGATTPGGTTYRWYQV